ncbi:GNAT family N-acetyltransferase [Flagellimonas lutimaris]|uniref:GNAT family N-acetyltransferase n=1 Tax=Flagellimonas lutimaris TaxID=475082 RepID=UPI0039C49E32|tara:strand:+ start:1496 stop:1840 length:345 start_codon:yes stop_codon:yes gene_type:complete
MLKNIEKSTRMFENSNINRLPMVFKSCDGKNYFQFHINGQLASLEYEMVKNTFINLTGLEMSKYLDRPEVGNALIERVMEYALRGDFKIIPSIPEVTHFLNKRPEYRRLIELEV